MSPKIARLEGLGALARRGVARYTPFGYVTRPTSRGASIRRMQSSLDRAGVCWRP